MQVHFNNPNQYLVCRRCKVNKNTSLLIDLNISIVRYAYISIDIGFIIQKKDSQNMQRNIVSAKLVPRPKFSPIKMLLMFPLIIMLIFKIIIAYWNYDKYSDLRKRFKGYRNVVPEPFEIKKHNFIIYGPSNTGKTTL